MVLAKVGAPIMGEIILTMVIVAVDFLSDCLGKGVQEVASKTFRNQTEA